MTEARIVTAAAPATTVPPPGRSAPPGGFARSFAGMLAIAGVVAIAAHLILRHATDLPHTGPGGRTAIAPLAVVVIIGGVPLIVDVVRSAVRFSGGADLLAAISIVTSVVLGEWLVAAIVVLMLSGGEALEGAASRRASATLDALARRAPSVAHRLRRDDAPAAGPGSAVGTDDIAAEDVEVGDVLVLLPHELCPVDGEVIAGRGSMDESYLTGEPYVVPKSVGSAVMSGAINGEAVLRIRAAARAVDSRYAKIVGVLREAEENRPPMRRLADRLGGWYTLVAVALGLLGWGISGDPTRFLAVVVVATPCPLLIGVPVAIIGAISLAARRGIIIKNPAMLEEVGQVRTVMFDKTGTLTYGRPVVDDMHVVAGRSGDEVLRLAAALEAYSKHPLAHAVVAAAEERGLEPPEVGAVAERPGRGLSGTVGGHSVTLTNRAGATAVDPDAAARLPATRTGLEAVVLVDDRYAATLRFRDQPRTAAAQFVAHLPRHHAVNRMMIVSGDRAAEVEHLAAQVGIAEVHAGVSPEGKLAIVREHTADAPTLFLGDGINDAPAMTAATVGVAFGAASDVTSEAADAVVLESSLERLDDLLHIGTRMRRIATQSVVAGMGLSIGGMILAVFGLLPPLAGAIAQEVIDIAVILNVARVPFVRDLADFEDADA